ncbi:hypothetical protein PR048_020726 [Dryococelus australis]|uniref:Integrase catalytic domain-containing protein n=1 Tax=Dryococelus australis TaxID=614101 RepID=A0ABQ9H7J5_9NEOP|nr:hypothetical protein PR048_020726 [Dryococelus australis]
MKPPCLAFYSTCEDNPFNRYFFIWARCGAVIDTRRWYYTTNCLCLKTPHISRAEMGARPEGGTYYRLGIKTVFHHGSKGSDYSNEILLPDCVYSRKQLIMADALLPSPCSTYGNWELTEEMLTYVYTAVSHVTATDTKHHEIAPDKSQLTKELIPCWQHRCAISLHNGLLFIGEHLVASHVSELKDLVEKCCTCAEFTLRKIEPLLPSEFPERPSQVVGADLLKCKADYFSKFTEIDKLDDLSVGTIIKHTKSIFTRHGVPEVVLADCRTQFNCSEFKQLAPEYNFILFTSSPHYPRSNGFVEAEVKNFKNNLQKSKLLMGRKLQTPLPTIPQCLTPYLVDTETLKKREGDRI